MAVQLSPELVDFISTTSSPIDIRPTDTGVLIDYPETTRLDLREDGGFFRLGFYERNEPPTFTFEGNDLQAIERQILIELGSGYRRVHKYGFIRLPYMPEDVHPGYTIEELEPYRYSLRRDDSTLVPIIIHDGPPRTVRTCRYSYVADQPLDAIITSYTNPTGAPLYADYVLPTVGIR